VLDNCEHLLPACAELVEALRARADDETATVLRAKALAYASFLAGFRGNRTAQMNYGRHKAAAFGINRLIKVENDRLKVQAGMITQVAAVSKA
jgi:hypothetical protein